MDQVTVPTPALVAVSFYPPMTDDGELRMVLLECEDGARLPLCAVTQGDLYAIQFTKEELKQLGNGILAALKPPIQQDDVPISVEDWYGYG